MKRTMIYLPDGVHKGLKELALEANTSVAELIRKAVNAVYGGHAGHGGRIGEIPSRPGLGDRPRLLSQPETGACTGLGSTQEHNVSLIGFRAANWSEWQEHCADLPRIQDHWEPRRSGGLSTESAWATGG